MKRIAFATLGCKANFVDTEEMAGACRRAGLAIVSFDDVADAYVINTCTVTVAADRQSRQLIRRPRRQSPNAVVIAVGCTGAVDPESVRSIDGVDAVFGTADRARAVAFLFEKLGAGRGGSGSPLTPTLSPQGRGMGEGWSEGRQSRARAFLKVQDGCDRSCAYCIVPLARGGARSVPPDEVERECLALARFHREIVLTGIDIGQYGCDLGGEDDLETLLARLLKAPGMPRLRLSSIDPTAVSDAIVGLMATSQRICRHVHLSVQSGSERVLERMGRGYGAAEIERAVRRLVDRVPDIAVTGDVIAGLPGEEDEDYRQTLRLLASLPLAGLHVFPYSVREGTRAALMRSHVPHAVRRDRAAELRRLAAEKRRAFLDGQMGRRLEAIVTSRAPDGEQRVLAFSDNAISISMPAGAVPYGEAGVARITEVNDLQARGIWEFPQRTRTGSSGSRSGWATSSAAAST